MTDALQGTGGLRIMLKGFYWNLYGGTIRNPPLPSQVRSILFICMGNICRSPFAEHIARKHVSYSKSYDISSAGIRVDEPIAPPQDAIVSAKSFGIDLSAHRSRKINYSMMESYDMVISMEDWQYKYLRKLFVEFENKLFLFPLFDRSHTASMNAYYKYNIQDPYGRNSDDFRKCYLRIDTCITQLLSKIGMIPEVSA